MARRESTAAGGRNRAATPARESTPQDQGPEGSAPEGEGGRAVIPVLGRLTSTRTLEEILQFERNRLARAQSVLGCLHVALLHANDRGIKEGPEYADAAATVLSMLREIADRLDAAYLRPVLKALAQPVRERRSNGRRR